LYFFAVQYPFGGLPNFPEAYPILLSGNAQSNTSVGDTVTGAASHNLLGVQQDGPTG
jgi:hypothetical protein